MSRVRVLLTLDRNLQRLGFMKRLVGRSEAIGSTSGDNIGNDLIVKITKEYSVEVTEQHHKYFTNRRLPKYRKIVLGDTQRFELQHLYLADPKMPSATGNLVKRDAKRYPWLAVALGILRQGTYSLTERGNSLFVLSQPELQAFNNFLQGNNPLITNAQQKILLLNTLLKKDGEVLRPLYRRLIEEYPNGFSEAKAAEFIPGIYHKIIDNKKRSMLSLSDRECLENLAHTAASVEDWIKTRDPNKGAWKHVVRFRLEAMVDIGWLSKSNLYSYDYQFTQICPTWADALSYSNESELDRFLDEEFFSVVGRTYYRETEEVKTQEEHLGQLFTAWKKLKSPQGYVPISELSTIAAIEGISTKGYYFEVNQTKEMLKKTHSTDPNLLRFSVDKRGALAHVKFISSPKGNVK